MKTLTSVEKRIEPSCPQYDIITSTQQVNLFLAGQGSGKTQCAGVISGRLICEYPNNHGFIGANTYTQLSDSTLFRIRKVWKEYFNWTEYSKENRSGNFVVDVKPPAHFNTEDHEYDTYHGKICFRDGTVIYKGSLDNYKAHEGKEFSWAILDETKDTKEAAVKEVILGRLREPGMEREGKPWNPLFIFTSPAKVQWINEWFKLDQFHEEIVSSIYQEDNYFAKKVDNKFAVISSVLHNLHNLPSNFLENQKNNFHSGLQDMLIYGNPFSQSGGEFYKYFDRSKHVRKFLYNPDLPLHLTFDFNVAPYMTGLVIQVRGTKVVQIGEICLKNPSNTTAAVCAEFIRLYQGHKAGLLIYGDPSGKKEDTRQEKGHNDYTIIMRMLSQFSPRNRVADAPPPVAMRGNFMNTIFEKEYQGIQIFINESCTHSINDYQYLKEAADGTKLKEKVKDPDTQVTYEKYGHTSDAFDYFICQAFAREWTLYQKSGVGGKIAMGKSYSKNKY